MNSGQVKFNPDKIEFIMIGDKNTRVTHTTYTAVLVVDPMVSSQQLTQGPRWQSGNTLATHL